MNPQASFLLPSPSYTLLPTLLVGFSDILFSGNNKESTISFYQTWLFVGLLLTKEVKKKQGCLKTTVGKAVRWSLADEKASSGSVHVRCSLPWSPLWLLCKAQYQKLWEKGSCLSNIFQAVKLFEFLDLFILTNFDDNLPRKKNNCVSIFQSQLDLLDNSSPWLHLSSLACAIMQSTILPQLSIFMLLFSIATKLSVLKYVCEMPKCLPLTHF